MLYWHSEFLRNIKGIINSEDNNEISEKKEIDIKRNAALHILYIIDGNKIVADRYTDLERSRNQFINSIYNKKIKLDISNILLYYYEIINNITTNSLQNTIIVNDVINFTDKNNNLLESMNSLQLTKEIPEIYQKWLDIKPKRLDRI